MQLLQFSSATRALVLAGALLVPGAGFTEDIDLFKGGAAITGQKPNILFIVDNTVNWNSNANHWPGGKQAQEELESLSTAVGGLTGDVRVGLMMIHSNKGYVRFGLRDMDATNRTAFQQLLAGMAANTGANDVPTSNGDYGALMHEAWKYFSGSSSASITSSQRDYTGNGSVNVSSYTAGNLSGNPLVSASSTTYVNPLSSGQPCNKNFIVFIGNGFPSSASTDPGTLGVTGWTAADSTQIYAEGSKTTYLDEWARFLRKTGAANKPCDTSVTPNICADNLVTTYTIDVFKDHADAPQTALLKSTAAVGGGKYFAATSKAEIQSAISRIISEIQAVNSVFTSASLPVSVNTQGTYLNQIYMGVFRPDSAGQPRWMGNLKQYKFGITTDATGNDTIFLADADGNAAVNSISGFVDPSARSYWTKSSSPTAGFWSFNPSGPGGQYDSPDGDLVEKGGAAQKLRDLGPNGRTIYTCSSAGCLSPAVAPSVTPGPNPDLFATSNTALTTALTGTSSTISSLTRISTTATATTAADLGLNSPTDAVTISGSSVAGYNGSWTATKVDGTHFTIPVVETPVTPATGATITVSSGTSVAQSVTAANLTNTIAADGKVNVYMPAGHGFINNQSVTIAGAGVSASMATATTKCAGYPSTATCEYNGTYNITYIDAYNFQYSPLTANLGSNTATSTVISPSDPILSPFGTTTISCGTGGSPTITTVSNSSVKRAAGGVAGNTRLVSVALASVPASCANPLVTNGNGRVNGVSVADTNSTVINGTPASPSYGAAACGAGYHFCYNVVLANVTATGATTTIIPASPATGTITATGIPTRAVTSITRTAGSTTAPYNVATVTVTTATPHGFGASTSVTIAGADQTEYNGTKTTATDALTINSGSSTMTFTLTTGPTTPAVTGGTVAKGSSIDPTTLINWVRGVDNKEDENINASLTDCRASIHGDVLHSRPLVINYGDAVGIYAYYGSNDGTFRAVKAGQDESGTSTDGKEVWAFVAPEHYNTLGRLYNNSPYIKYKGDSSPKTPRDYFFDGNIGVFQKADLSQTHIFISMRRGGRFIYALDVSTPTSPKFLWKKTYLDAGFSELGYTWSEPKVIALKKTGFTACRTSDSGLSTDATSSYTRALVFGAGYDPASDDTTDGNSRPVATMGRGVFVLKAEDGSLIKLLQAPANDFKGQNNSARMYPIPSDVTLLDTDGDGCIDRVYAGDTGAKLHRFDLNDVDPANWKAYTIATLGDSGNNGTSNDRKFLYPPEVVLSVLNGSQIAYVMAGTGNREEPSSTAVDNRFYMIRDSIAVGTTPAISLATATYTVKESQLTELTNFNAATTTIDPTAAAFKGWYLDFESGEKAVNAALTVAGTTFFGTNKPKAVDPRSCEANLGTARGYALNFLNGTASVGDRDGNGTINRTDLYSVFKGGGLPPSPVSGVVQISPSKTVRFVIGSGGDGTTGSAIEGVKTQVNPSGTRTRVFWYFKKDD